MVPILGTHCTLLPMKYCVAAMDGYSSREISIRILGIVHKNIPLSHWPVNTICITQTCFLYRQKC